LASVPAERAHIFVLSFAILITLGSALGVYREWNDHILVEDSARQANRAVEQLQELLSLLKDVETGQRGYLLTGESRYLEPYNAAHPEINRLLGQMESPQGRSGDTTELKRLIAAKFAEVDRTIALRRSGDVGTALDVVATDQGKITMDEIRQMVQRDIRSRLAQVRSQMDLVKAHENRLRWTIITGSVFVTLLLLLATQRIHRLLQSRTALIQDLDRTQAGIEREKEVFKTTLASIGDAVIATDEQGRPLFMNAVAESLTGWRLDEASRSSLRDVFCIINETTREPVEDPVSKVLREGTVVGLANHTLLKCRDGREIPIDDSGAPIRDSAGRLTGVVLVFRDVTKQRMSHAQLVDSERRYRLMFETNPQPMWVYETGSLRFLDVNESAIRHYGYSREEFLSRTLRDIRPAEDIPALLKDTANPSTVRHTDGPWTHRKKDGSLIEVQITSHPIDFQGRDARFVMVHDITDQRRAQKALAEKEAGFRLLFEDNPQPMWVFDARTFQFMEVNRAAIAHYGFTREEFLARRVMDVRLPEEVPSFLEEMDRQETGVRHPGLSRHRVKDGSLIEVDVVYLRIEFNGTRAIFAVLHDVSEKRRLEDQLRQAQKLEAVGRLAGGVAHDFNNLLTVITGYGDMLLRGVATNDRPIEEILKASERASGLTRQLLAFSRRQVLQPQVLNLSNSVSRIVDMLGRLLGEDVTLATQLDTNLWDVSADPGQIDQIIMNLAVNARDAMESGGTLTIQTANVHLDDSYASSHVGVAPGDFVSLSIIDTGTGMSEETKARLFEPFFTTKEVGRGTGLGLSTVYGIVKQSGGNIWVYSEFGKGTTFNIYLPRFVGATERQAPVTRTARKSVGNEAILIVEDDPTVRKLVAAMMSNCGYSTMVADNAEQALALCDDPAVKMDLIISDLVMPGMDGREFGRRALELRPEVRVLYMSGYTEHAVLRQNIFESGEFFVQKPFSHAMLANKVRDILDARTTV
jgi:PAS domain S-box-containing protein